MKLIYVAACPSYGRGDHVKVGVSKDPHKRLKCLWSEYDHLLKIVAIYSHEKPYRIEAETKKHFIKHRFIGSESFFIQADEAMAFIESLGAVRL